MPGIYLYHSIIPAPVIPAPPGIRQAFQMTWTGWDGSAWDLSDGSDGLFLMQGIRGLSMPPVEHFTQESPAIPGSRNRGSRVLEREVFWPLYIYSEGESQDFVDWDRAFWKTMRPEKTGVWTVTQPNGTQRSLSCRFRGDEDHSFERDPSSTGWELYGVTLVAEQPFWQGPLISRTWIAPGAATGFFAAGGPPFTIVGGSTLNTATMDNPGDVNAYPTYTVTGPTTSVTVGVGGRIVEVPFALSLGQSLTIDTNPDKQTAIDNSGVDRTSELGQVDFAPIPPQAGATMSLTMVGSGLVTASIRPGYYRAW